MLSPAGHETAAYDLVSPVHGLALEVLHGQGLILTTCRSQGDDSRGAAAAALGKLGSDSPSGGDPRRD
jgi:hypothetical protein